MYVTTKHGVAATSVGSFHDLLLRCVRVCLCVCACACVWLCLSGLLPGRHLHVDDWGIRYHRKHRHRRFRQYCAKRHHGTMQCAAPVTCPNAHTRRMQALDTMSTMGDVEVTRSVYTPVSAEYTNTYTWTVTFVHQTVDFADFTADASGLSGAANMAVTIGTASSPLTNDESDAANVMLPAARGCLCVAVGAVLQPVGLQVQVNEVQLIECTCAATCSGSTKFKLGQSTSVAVAHDATSATIEAALEVRPAVHACAVHRTWVIDRLVGCTSACGVCVCVCVWVFGWVSACAGHAKHRWRGVVEFWWLHAVRYGRCHVGDYLHPQRRQHRHPRYRRLLHRKLQLVVLGYRRQCVVPLRRHPWVLLLTYL